MGNVSDGEGKLDAAIRSLGTVVSKQDEEKLSEKTQKKRQRCNTCKTLYGNFSKEGQLEIKAMTNSCQRLKAGSIAVALRRYALRSNKSSACSCDCKLDKYADLLNRAVSQRYKLRCKLVLNSTSSLCCGDAKSYYRAEVSQ